MVYPPLLFPPELMATSCGQVRELLQGHGAAVVRIAAILGKVAGFAVGAEVEEFILWMEPILRNLVHSKGSGVFSRTIHPGEGEGEGEPPLGGSPITISDGDQRIQVRAWKLRTLLNQVCLPSTLTHAENGLACTCTCSLRLNLMHMYMRTCSGGPRWPTFFFVNLNNLCWTNSA